MNCEGEPICMDKLKLEKVLSWLKKIETDDIFPLEDTLVIETSSKLTVEDVEAGLILHRLKYIFISFVQIGLLSLK